MAIVSWLRSNWLAMLIGLVIGRFLLVRLV